MTSKALFIRMTSILMLSLCITGNCLAQNDKKSTYKFTDNRISQADTLLSHKDYDRALEAYQKALQTYEADSFHEGMVYAIERMAFCYRRLKNDELSAKTFQKAIDLAKEKLEPNHMLLSKAYLNNGIRAHAKVMGINATALIDSAMIIFKRSRSTERNIEKNIIRYKFYTYYYYNNNRDTVIKYLDSRLRVLESEKFDTSQYVYLLNDYSMTYNSIGHYEKALSYALKAQKYSNNMSVPFHYRLESLFNFGKSLLNIREFEEAVKVADQLITIVKRDKPDYLELLSYYNLKAVSLVQLQAYDSAIKEYQNILYSINSTNTRLKESKFYDDVVMNIGVAYQMKGQYDSAKTYLLESLQGTLNRTQNIKELSSRYKYVGNLFRDSDNPLKALQYYDLGIQSFVPGYFDFTNSKQWNFPSDIAFENLNDLLDLMMKKSGSMINLFYKKEWADSSILNSVITLVERTHSHLNKNRNKIVGSQSKLLRSNRNKLLYSSGLEASFNLHTLSKNNTSLDLAFNYMSDSKSALFLEQAGNYSSLRNDIIPSHLREEFILGTRSYDSLSNIINRQIAFDPLGDSVMILNTEKMRWNARLAEVREAITKGYPDAGNDFLSKEVSPESLRRDHQLTSEKALVEYFVGDSVIFVVGLSGEKASFHRIEKNETFNAALSSFLGEVNTAPNTREMDRHLKSFGEASHMLYNALLKPVLDDLGEMEELIIVPDEILSRVPFELLISKWSGRETSFKELNYLLKGTKVSHLLSSKISFNEFAQSQGKGMLGIGYTGEGIADERAAMGGLPGALKEINFLKSNFEGDYYLGKEGTKRQFLKKAGNYDVIHLALHGISDSVNRYNSALVFNGDRDYYMTSTDLYRTRLKSRLAVLSACETGIGKISEGEGSFSIARGFAIAGVPAIITTLWKVNDQAGASIMEQFYRNLKAGRKKDDALRQAKLNYMQQADNLSSSPFYWGNYILIGDTREIELKEKGNLPWYWVLITLLILGTLGLSLRRLSRKPFNQVP